MECIAHSVTLKAIDQEDSTAASRARELLLHSPGDCGAGHIAGKRGTEKYHRCGRREVG